MTAQSVTVAARGLLPGMMVSGTVAVAAAYLGEHYHAPTLLLALLIGMSLHFLHADNTSSAAGIEFAAKRLLKIAVALLGAQITIADIAGLGWQAIAMVCAAAIATILFGVALAVLTGRSKELGLLTGGAVAICGASAAIAIFSVIPEHRLRHADLVLTVVAVTTLSTIAMVFYPLLSVEIGLDARTSGILIGATIHDVAQVVGAGYAVSDVTGHVATTVKLVRVAMLAPLVVILSFLLSEKRGVETFAAARLPGFAIAFAALVVVNSLGWIPPLLEDALSVSSRWFLVAAIAGLGMMTSLKALGELGYRHLIIVAGETIWLLLIVLASIHFSGLE